MRFSIVNLHSSASKGQHNIAQQLVFAHMHAHIHEHACTRLSTQAQPTMHADIQSILGVSASGHCRTRPILSLEGQKYLAIMLGGCGQSVCSGLVCGGVSATMCSDLYGRVCVCVAVSTREACQREAVSVFVAISVRQSVLGSLG